MPCVIGSFKQILDFSKNVSTLDLTIQHSGSSKLHSKEYEYSNTYISKQAAS